MTLFTQIKTDQLAARKAKDTLTASLLTTLIGELTAVGKNDGNREVTDADVIKLVKKFKDGMEQTVKFCENSNPEGAAIASTEIKIISKYMPQQMDEAALTSAINDIISQVGSNLGKVMGELKIKYNGLYDGKLAAAIAKNSLH